ncbi:hypothetical protein MLD38_007270 [Melastoma candidum]|uniref:Uncharacterized protein n=1 Tax=Melastoma candidum TaxID=119954 RepID=A0ACB9RRT9_9MYRT|nr:hypothetical protein MLD38_007270 [Melastoma candidum]
MKQRRSGYEPSDTETEWNDRPRRELKLFEVVSGSKSPIQNRNDDEGDVARKNTSPLKVNRRQISRGDHEGSFRKYEATSARRRYNSKSPYKSRLDDDGAITQNFILGRNLRVSPPLKPEQRRYASPYRMEIQEEEFDDDNDATRSARKPNGRTPTREDASRASMRSNYSQRSVTAPKQRPRDRERLDEQMPSPISRSVTKKHQDIAHTRKPSIGELNEMVASLKLQRDPHVTLNLDSTESIQAGDIFFSRDVNALAHKKGVLPPPKNDGPNRNFPLVQKFAKPRDNQLESNASNGRPELNQRLISSKPITSQALMTSSTIMSRQSSNMHGRVNSKFSDTSLRTTESMQKFTDGRRKNQMDTWFTNCMRRNGRCRSSSSPEAPRRIDESSYIERAIVVEHLRQFWADKHQPRSLDGFHCHKREAQLLKKLVSTDSCPHLMFKGPPGAGKRALTAALLLEIYGDEAQNVSHEQRNFNIQDERSIQVGVPITTSSHHVELNVKEEPNSRHVLMSIVKEISASRSAAPEVSRIGLKPEYKVIVLYQVDKAAETIQHLLKWIIDCYSDVCKLIICCEDDVNILESVRSRCKIINVAAPITHEIIEILIQIGRKEDFELPMSFAAKIAGKSKQNVRKAIMALEACKAHSYPFADGQPIPMGWEQVVMDLATEILADPSQKRVFFIRGKIQKLLVDFVHPKLILQMLVQQFLKVMEAGSKRELYYWHAYYDKRLPNGTSALLKLEEFVAKFMSIYRKSSSSRRYM